MAERPRAELAGLACTPVVNPEHEGAGTSVRAGIRRLAGEAVVVSWPESARRDIDVPADYEGARAKLGLKGP